MPLWFLPVLGSWFFKRPVTIDDAIDSGELFIYAAAVAGPLVYVITKRYGEFEAKPAGATGVPLKLTISFPYGGLFVGVSAFMCILAGFAFTVLKNPVFADAGKLGLLNYNGIKDASWFAASFATLMVYLVTAYKNSLETVSRTQARQEQAFVEDWIGHKQ